jgi:ubiquinone/menaquinone biosynthesis C-methylase UbiE
MSISFYYGKKRYNLPREEENIGVLIMANDSKKLSKERFGEFAAGYVTSKTHAKGSDLDRLIDIAQPRADWHALDIATGGGHTALKFAPHVARVVASDITPQMLEKAREFIQGQGVVNVTFKEADAENLPFEEAQFDLVTCRIAPPGWRIL